MSLVLHHPDTAPAPAPRNLGPSDDVFGIDDKLSALCTFVLRAVSFVLVTSIDATVAVLLLARLIITGASK